MRQARIDHANRAARIALAQSKVNQQGVANAGARGVDDLDVSPTDSAKSEKNISQNPDINPKAPTKKVRGEE